MIRATIHHYTKRFVEYITSIFLRGLFTILPLALTVMLINGALSITLKWLAPLQKLAHGTILHRVPYAELLLTIGFILALGAIMRIFILRSVIHAVEDILFSLPLIRPIYSGIKQLVNAFSIHDKLTFKQVILVQFPRNGVYSIGFMTSELPEEISPSPSVKHYNVFIPTTPNPTSGFFVIIPEDAIIHIDLSRQEAMAMIISGGIIQPERFIDLKKVR